MRGDLPAAFGEAVIAYKRKLAEDRSPIATRKASQATLEVLANAVPELLTGSADLTPSNNTKVAATPDIGPSSYSGRYIHWGVREHGMAAAAASPCTAALFRRARRKHAKSWPARGACAASDG